MTLAVKVALNPNTANQTIPAWLLYTRIFCPYFNEVLICPVFLVTLVFSFSYIPLLWVLFFLSHDNLCFPCNIAITNFLSRSHCIQVYYRPQFTVIKYLPNQTTPFTWTYKTRENVLGFHFADCIDANDVQGRLKCARQGCGLETEQTMEKTSIPFPMRKFIVSLAVWAASIMTLKRKTEALLDLGNDQRT